MSPFEFLDSELKALKLEGRLRNLCVVDGPSDAVLSVDGRKLINFSSNNYLGLANDPRVKEAARAALERYGAGSGASRLISGTQAIHRRLEEAIARFEGRPSALVFTSGYQANIGLVTGLVGPGDAVFSDRLNHASIIDACRLSRAKFFLYPHGDTGVLEELLQRASGLRRRLIITDGVFSMDGDLAPLSDIAALARTHRAMWAVDEAHGTGVLGEHGRGAHEALSQGGEGIVMGTLSKALGTLGGFVAGDERLMQYLVNRSRSFIYTTALAPACAGGAIESLRIVREEPWRRKRLRSLSTRIRRELARQGWELRGDVASPIIPVVTRSVQRTMRTALFLFEEGLFIPGIRPPTVPEGEGRLRISLMTGHTDAHVERLIEVFRHARDQIPAENEKVLA